MKSNFSLKTMSHTLIHRTQTTQLAITAILFMLTTAIARGSEMVEFSGSSKNVKYQAKIKSNGEGELVIKTTGHRYTCPLALDSKHVYNGRNPHLEVRFQRKPCTPKNGDVEAALREKTELHLSPYAKNSGVAWLFEYAGGLETSRLKIQELPFIEFMRRPASENDLEPYQSNRQTFDYTQLK